MELVLNLAWVLLALPAYWLWRRGAGAQQKRCVTSVQCLLTLGCVLVLLFPVISASDDLHAMQAEMEESATSKRAVRQAASDKSSAWTNRMQSPPIMAASATRLGLDEVGLLEVPVTCFSPLARPCVLSAGRAPPFSLLG
ncbi:MAG TPA: hypothetical protein VFF64_22710 [Candidatus Eremiobacteraceae bacterium]|nr:hypothetical protein [Candidatus Eremiobacteraceae bacterium]